MSEERTEEPRASVASQAPPEAQEVPSAHPEVPAVDGGDSPHPASSPATPARAAAEAAPEARNGTPPDAAAAPEVPSEDVSFDEFAASMAAGTTVPSLKEGDVVRGVVVHVDREGVLVDVGTKSEGLIPPHELSREAGKGGAGELQVGSPLDVYVLSIDDEEGQLVLSKRRADFEKAWDQIIEAHQQGTTINAEVTDRVKGGLVVDLGIRGFVPASHVGTGKVRNLEKFIGETLPLKVIEVDRDRRKVVLSHRLATEEEREAQRQETLATLAEGQVREGVVRRITDYGAFVDIGGVDGLLHISEMAWTRIKHPSDILKVGDELQVMVLKTNLEQGRISLGLRQILPDPWTEARDRYQPGDVVHGVVTRLVPFGAFVQLDGGIEGIVPNSELTSRRISKPDEVVQVGDHVEVKVVELRPEERRMTLSIRQALEEKEYAEYESYERGAPSEQVTIGEIVGEFEEEEEEGEQEE